MRVELWTDGGCYPNPGPGAWAFILVAYTPAKPRSRSAWKKLGEIERVGTEAHTTNNRMELAAVMNGLRALKRPTEVTVFSDSNYVVQAMTHRWPVRWQLRGWRRPNNDPVLNADLWQELIAVARPHTITWQHVKGHAGNHYNERCDRLCTAAYRTGAV